MFLSTVLLSESQRQLHISDYDNALEETEFCVCVGGGGDALIYEKIMSMLSTDSATVIVLGAGDIKIIQ